MQIDQQACQFPIQIVTSLTKLALNSNYFTATLPSAISVSKTLVTCTCVLLINSKQFFNHFVRQHGFQVPIIVSFLTLISFISCIFVYFEKKTIRFDCKCAELRSSFSCYGFLTLCVNPQLFKGTVVIFNNIIMNSLSENLF